jgi:anti-anti-sigma regulatory factor
MRAREEGYELVAYGLSNHYRQIFTITRLTDFIHVTDDEENAVKTLSLIT